jgi:DNA polymerase III gamma/tau subunit
MGSSCCAIADVIAGGSQVTEQAVKEAWEWMEKALFRCRAACCTRSCRRCNWLRSLPEKGYDPRLCRDLLEHFRHLVAAKISPDPMLLADLPDHEVTIVRQQASGCSLEDIQRFFTLLLHADEEISKTPYAQLVVEMTLVKLASQPPIMPIEEALTL